jgi:hypothetical protein
MDSDRVIRQTAGLFFPCRTTKGSRSQNSCESMDVARGYIEISGSIIAQPLRNLTLRHPELLPELLVRRRAILTAICARSSCCINLRQRNLRSQSVVWHNVAGFCPMLFPRFRKTPAIPTNVSCCPSFTSADKIPLRSPIPGKNLRKRLTSSKPAICVTGTFMSETSPNNSQRSQLF